MFTDRLPGFARHRSAELGGFGGSVSAFPGLSDLETVTHKHRPGTARAAISGRDLRDPGGLVPGSVWGDAGSPSPSPLWGRCVCPPRRRSPGPLGAGPWDGGTDAHAEASQPRTVLPLGPGCKVQPRKGAWGACGVWGGGSGGGREEPRLPHACPLGRWCPQDSPQAEPVPGLSEPG